MTKKEALSFIKEKRDISFLKWALWRHFPEIDLDPEKHSDALFHFLQEYDFLFIKVTPASGLFPESLGAKLTYQKPYNDHGTRTYITLPVREKEDWEKIKKPKKDFEPFLREYKTLNLLRKKIGDNVSIFQTIFSPLSICYEIAQTRFFKDLYNYPEKIEKILKLVTETVLDFAISSKRTGADGIFFAVKLASKKYMDEDDYKEFGIPYDLNIINELRKKFEYIVLHLHGEDIYFNLFLDFPVDFINWHSRETKPDIRTASKEWQGGIIGGLNSETLAYGTKEEINEEVKDFTSNYLRNSLLGAGCVMLTPTPRESLKYVKNLLKKSQNL